MMWAALALGLGLTVFGATAGASLVAICRLELTRAVSWRLRGASGPMTRLGRIDRLLGTASATTAAGVVLLGAVLPAALSGASWWLPALVGVFVAVPAVLLGGYLFPRWLTQRRAESVAKYVIPVLEVWSRGLGWLLPSRRGRRGPQLRSLWREGAATGIGVEADLHMIGGVITFTERPVRDVMTPRTDIVAVEEGRSVEEIAAVFKESGYTRLPVYRETLDHVVGMVHAFDVFKLKPGQPLRTRPVAFAPASRPCVDLLLDMQRERQHLAVVMDEFGGTLGIATMEDLLEELVGEIYDEDEDQAVAPSAVEPVAPFEVQGSTPPGEVEERFGVTLPEARSQTMSGLLTELAGRIPTAGERFLLQGLEIDVIEATPTTLRRILIRPGPVQTVPLRKERV